MSTDPTPVQIRTLTTLPALETVNDVFAEVWGEGAPRLPLDLLRAMSHADGYVAGAFDGDRMVGASFGFLALHHGELSLHSHVTGVVSAARGLHVGTALKEHQRDWARERGVAAITWTFDPLVRRNAWFNLGRLGARPVDYLVDFYGDLGDDINAGDESDRLLVRWDVAAPVASDADPPEIGAKVRTPDDIEALRRSDPAQARAWRRRMRDDLLEVARQGRVVGFSRGGDYLIAP